MARNGVPVTHPARAAIEVVTAYGAEAGLVAACGVLNRELTTLAELQEVAKDADALARQSRHPARPRARRRSV